MDCKLLRCLFVISTANLSLLFAQDQFPSWEEKHSDEPFIYLVMERTVELNSDWSTRETIHMVAKIQKESAQSLGEIPIEYDEEFQKVKEIKAFIITPEGKKLRYKSLQSLTPYAGEPLYSSNRIKVITMPNVVPGSIIDWEATIITQKPIIKDAFWDLFEFSIDAPVKTLRYKLIIPRDTPIQIKSHNIDVIPQIKEEGDKIIYVWQRDFVDKFEPEEFMPPWDEFIGYVEISTIRSWEDIANWYWGLVNKNLKISPAMKEKVKELVKNKNKLRDKIQAVIKYIRDNFRYVSMSFGYNNYEPHPSDEVFDNKYGDCKDQVLLCMAMLKEAGITAYPALFCSENKGNPREKLPAPSHFDHVILGIESNGKMYYTDILEKGYRFDEISLNLEGGYVYVINDKGGFFYQIPILDELTYMTYRNSTIHIKKDGSAVIEVTSLWPKDLSIYMRENWKNMTEKQRQEVLESLDETYTSGGKMLERKWENMDSSYKQIKSYIKYERPGWAEVAGDFITFSPCGGAYERRDIFVKEERKYPIMSASNSLSKETWIYYVPEGFEIVYCPEGIHLKNKLAEFSRTYKVEDSKIIAVEIMRYKRVRLPAEYYKEMKNFYNKLAILTRQKVILKRKGVP